MGQQRNLALNVGVVGVVDDDPAVRNSLKFSLEIEGLAVAVYADADDLLKDSDLARFDCLVVDQRLPGLSGLDLVAELRDREFRVPVILITSQPSRAVMAQADKAGVPIVEKPLWGNALLDKMRVLVVPPTQPSAC